MRARDSADGAGTVGTGRRNADSEEGCREPAKGIALPDKFSPRRPTKTSPG